MDFKEAYPDTCSTVAMAARLGDVTLMQEFINKGKPPDVKDNRGWMAIHEAASTGHLECLKILMEIEVVKMNVDVLTFEDETALMLACNSAHHETALMLACNSAHHETALMLACNSSHHETALMLACNSAHHQCVQLLLEGGACPNAKTKEDFTPLWFATKHASGLQCVEAIVKTGGDVNSAVYTLDTPVHNVIQMHGDEAMLRYLLTNGADVQSRTENGHTPIFTACQLGRLNCLNILLDHCKKSGEDYLKEVINIPAVDHASPLYIAAQEAFPQVCEMLLQNGADPTKYTVADGCHIYPIQVALLKSLRCAEILLKVTDMKKYKTYIHMLYHPIVIALQRLDNKCMNMLMQDYSITDLVPQDQDGLQQLFALDNIELDPFLVLAKKHPQWFQDNFRKNWLNFPMIMENLVKFKDLEQMKLLFLIFLRLGAITRNKRYRVWSGIMDKSLNEELVVHALAVFKYQLKHKVDLDHIEEQRCREWSLDLIGISCSTILMKICLTRNFMRCDLNTQFRNLGKVRSDHPELDDILSEDKDLEKKGRHIKEACTTLQHMCRIVVVHKLIEYDKYTTANIKSLGVPTLLQNYLQYAEFGKLGAQLVEGFQILVSTEMQLDAALADI